MRELTKNEFERYSRQIILPEIGIQGQKRLKSARVLIVGAGGLGSPLAIYLAAAGIGKIGIVDFDEVMVSNLHRQIIFDSSDTGSKKAETAKQKLLKLNPELEVEVYNVKLTKENAYDVIKPYDVIADGSDNFATRYLVNDASVLLGKPSAYGSVLKFSGQVSFFDSLNGPCYRCLYPQPPLPGEVPSCEDAGVIGVLPGIVGTMQANEIIKYILDIGELLTGRLITIDALNMKFREYEFEKDTNCPICGANPIIRELINYAEVYENNQTINGNTVEPINNEWEITVEELKKKMDNNEKFVLIDIREPYEAMISSIGGELIPMNLLLNEIESYGKDEEIILYCKKGYQSENATKYLREKMGYKKVKNLIGGIFAWSERIDSSIKKY
jgi:adenylyltransferase/sulfurtransferase